MDTFKKLLFLYNPHAGKEQIKTHLSEILIALQRPGWLTTVFPTSGPTDAYRFAMEHGAEYDRIVVSGGDGTLHEVVNGLMRWPREDRPPIGYVPAGSTNDFAISHAIPTDMVTSAEMIAAGQPHRFDIGSFNDQYFTYVAAFGSFTDVTYDTPQDVKNVFGHLAYVAEGARRLPTYRPLHVKLTADGEMIEGDFIVGLIANSTSVGGMKLPYTDISLQDGVCELVLVRMQNGLDLWNILSDVVAGQFDSEVIIYRKVRRVTVESETPIAWTLDGEFGGSLSHAVIEALPLALELICGPEEDQV